MKTRLFSGVALVLSAVVAACRTAPVDSPAPPVGDPPPRAIESDQIAQTARPAERRPECSELAPPRELVAGRARTSSAVALAVRRQGGKGTHAYVADPDSLSIATLDLTQREFVGAASSSGPARELLVLPSGHVIASIEHASHLDVLAPTEAGVLEPLCSLEVPRGPAGMALSEDGATLAVASRTASTVTFLDATTFSVQKVVNVPRAPSGLLFVGDQLWVSHLVGSELTRLDVAGRATFVSTSLVARRGSEAQVFTGGVFAGFPRSSFGTSDGPDVRRASSQAFALVRVDLDASSDDADEGRRIRGVPEVATPSTPRRSAPRPPRIVAPMVSVDPGNEAQAAIPVADYYGPPPTFGVPKQSATAFVLDAAAGAALTRQILGDQREMPATVCLSPRAAAFDRRAESLFVTCLGSSMMLELDARSVDPMRAIKRTIATPQGPTGVAIAEEEGLVLVVGAFEGKVAVYDFALRERVDVLLSEARSTEARTHARGRDLFYQSDARIAFDGLSCASCHVEGEDDGLTWQTPEGPRQTLMLAGRVPDSAPYGWSRNASDAHEYVQGTIARLGGEGLVEEDLAALVGYVRALPAPPAELVDAAKAAEGERLFVARGCASCHPGGSTDTRKHTLSGEVAFDSPSLVRVGLSAPYFHDGRYRSLRELLADRKSSMGETATLRKDEIDKIELFLRSL
jgi:DNA-binding beta-propeller fold protein YncE